MKKVAFFLALVLAFAPLGLAYFAPDDSDSVSNSINTTSSVKATALLVIPTTYALRAASGATAGTIAVLSDGNGSDCGHGSGSTQTVCISNGTSWVKL